MPDDGQKLPPVIGELQLAIDQFQASLDDAKEKLTEFTSTDTTVVLTADDTDIDEKIDTIEGQLEELTTRVNSVKIDADDEEAKADLNDLKIELDALTEKVTDPKIEIDAEEAQAEIDDLKIKLDELKNDPVVITVEAETEEAESKLAEVDAEKKAVATPSLLSLLFSDGGATLKILSLGESALGTGAKFMAMGGLGSAAFALVEGAAVALPGILAGGTFALAGMVLGLKNVISATEAYTTAQQTSGTTAAQTAETEASGVQQVEQAKFQLAQAQQALTNTTLNNDYSMISATEQLADAQMQSANTMRSANEAVVQSEQALVDAQEQEKVAQLNLTAARIAAANALQNYNDQLHDGALAIQQDQLNVQQAQLNLNSTLADPSATALQRQQAQLSYQEALQQLQDQKDQYAQLQVTAATAAQQGVNGNLQVIEATQGVIDATNAVGNAQTAVTDANINLQQQQILTVQQVSDAQNNLAKTIQNNAASEASAIAQVQQAQEGVVSASTLAALSVQAAVTANVQLAQAMAKLSPAGQQFVLWYEADFKPILQQLSQSAQTGLLPGLETSLQSLIPWLDAVKEVLFNSGAGFADFANHLADFFSSGQGLADFTDTLNNAFNFMDQLGDAVVLFAQGLGSLGSVGGPALDTIGNAIDHFAQHFAMWASGSGPIGVIKEFQSVAKEIGPVLNPGVDAALAMYKYFGPIGGFIGLFHTQLAPLIGPLLQFAATAVKIAQTDLGPVIQGLAQALGPLLTALTPLLKPLGDIAGALGQSLIQAIQILAPVIESLVGPMTDILNAIEPIIGPLVWLTIFAEVFITAMKGWDIITGIAATVQAAFDVITGAAEGADVAMDANPVGALIAILVVLGVELTIIAKHWSQFWGGAEIEWTRATRAIHISWLFDDLKKLGDWLYNNMPGVWHHILDGLHFNLSNVESDLVQWVKDIPNALTAVGNVMWDVGKWLVMGLWNGWNEDWNSFTGWIVNEFWNCVHRVEHALGISSPSTVFADIGRNMIQGLWNGVVEVWNGFLGWASGMPSDIWGIFVNAGTWLYNVGHNIVVGLWNGISGNWDWLTKSVSNIARSFVKGVESIFGISSPSTVFHEMGTNLMQGLANGITNSSNLPSEALKAMASSLTLNAPSLASSLRVSGGGVLDSGTGANPPSDLHLTLQVNGSDFAKLVVPDVWTALLQKQRQTPLGLARASGFGGPTT